MWGCDAEGAIHNPTNNNITWKRNYWGTGSSTITKVVNKAGKVNYVIIGDYNHNLLLL